MKLRCGHCFESKELSFFNKDSWAIRGYRSECKPCRHKIEYLPKKKIYLRRAAEQDERNAR